MPFSQFLPLSNEDEWTTFSNPTTSIQNIEDSWVKEDLNLTNETSISTYRYSGYYLKEDKNIPKEQDWLITYCQNTTGEQPESSATILISPQITHSSIGRDSNINVTTIVNQIDEQRRLLRLDELYFLLEILINRKSKDATIINHLTKLAREYKQYDHNLLAICCYVAADIINYRLGQSDGQALHSEIIICCRAASKNLQNDTLLERFVLLNNIRVVEFLLKNKELLEIKINEPVGLARTMVLNIACKAGHIEILELLLKYGADIIAHSHRETCLYVACKAGQEKVVDRLLSHSEVGKIIDLSNKSDDCGDTALHIAVKEGWISIANKLINANADITLRNNFGKPGNTVLTELLRSHKAKDVQWQDALACLLMQKHPGFSQDFNERLLSFVVEQGLYQFFINYSLNFINNDNILELITIAYRQITQKPFHEEINAIKVQSCKNILLYIIAHSNELHIEESKLLYKLEGYSCNLLCLAVKDMQKDIVECILTNYPNSAGLASGGKAPLHYAVENEKDNVEMVKLLWNGSIDLINTPSEYDGFNLLHRSVLRGNVKITQFLLSNGALSNLKTQNNEKDTSLTLLSKTSQNLIKQEAIERCFKIGELLIQHGADLTLTNHNGETALQIQENTRGGGHQELIKVLSRKTLKPRS